MSNLDLDYTTSLLFTDPTSTDGTTFDMIEDVETVATTVLPEFQHQVTANFVDIDEKSTERPLSVSSTITEDGSVRGSRWWNVSEVALDHASPLDYTAEEFSPSPPLSAAFPAPALTSHEIGGEILPIVGSAEEDLNVAELMTGPLQMGEPRSSMTVPHLGFGFGPDFLDPAMDTDVDIETASGIGDDLDSTELAAASTAGCYAEADESSGVSGKLLPPLALGGPVVRSVCSSSSLSSTMSTNSGATTSSTVSSDPPLSLSLSFSYAGPTPAAGSGMLAMAAISAATQHQPVVPAPPATAVTPPSIGTSRARRGCGCHKSHCLKLYCECFAAKEYCEAECNCKECYNTKAHEHLLQAAILQRKDRGQAIPEAGGSSGRKYCTCKKSKCIKKYCDCFSAGIVCSEKCRCDGCENTDSSLLRQAKLLRPKRPRQKTVSILSSTDPAVRGGLLPTAPTDSHSAPSARKKPLHFDLRALRVSDDGADADVPAPQAKPVITYASPPPPTKGQTKMGGRTLQFKLGRKFL